MLIFDEATHTYTLNGKRLPSVTQILKPLYDFSMVPADVLKRAGEFGTAVHKTVELYLLGDLDEEALDEGLKGPLAAFKDWEISEGILVLPSDNIEVIGFHRKLLYAGTPDIETESVIIDLKSRPVNMVTDPLQLAAYDHLGNGNRARYVLELKQDGTYVFTHVNPTKKASTEAWSRFRFLLDHHNNTQIINSWRNK